MKRVIYNYKKEEITGTIPVLLKEEFGKKDENGEQLRFPNGAPVVDWPEEDKTRDSDGFLKEPIVGEMWRIKFRLVEGMKLCRYGSPNGVNTTIVGTPYELISLPYDPKTVEYHEYVVTAKAVDVDCYVDFGFAAPAFDVPGKGIQFHHYRTIKEECDNGNLKEVFEWLQ